MLLICCAGDFSLPDIDWSNESIVGYKYPHCINTGVLNMMHLLGWLTFQLKIVIPYSLLTNLHSCSSAKWSLALVIKKRETM